MFEQFTNDQVLLNGFQHPQLQQGDHQLLGILHSVRARMSSMAPPHSTETLGQSPRKIRLSAGLGRRPC